MRDLDRLLDIMARLRDPARGCPWDLAQSYETIAPHTIEEAYEVADAIAQGDMAALKDELGDLLFQVVFYAQMAREDGAFDFSDVAAAASDKMERRHPHIFGEAKVGSAAEQSRAWEELKAAERAAKSSEAASVLDGVAIGLPALARAAKLQKRAARVGFDWARSEDILDKIAEEAEELRAELADADRDRIEDEVGDLLFAVANLARHLDIDPEAALRRANGKFDRRFRSIEKALARQGRSPEQSNLEEMESLWQAAKRRERGEPAED